MREPRVASGTLIPYLKTAKDLHVNPDGVLAELGLTLDLIYDKQTRIPVSQNVQLLRRLIELSGNPGFGLHSARHVDMGSYDINGYISVNCRCPLEALELTADYYGILSDQRVLYVAESLENVVAQWVIPGELDEVARHIADHLMASYAKFGQSILGMEGAISQATFKHSAPRDSELLRFYEETFNCKLLFDQAHYSLYINREMARDVRIPQADRELRDLLIAHAQRRLRELRSTPPFTYQVKGVIKRMLEVSVPSREGVAEKLNMGSRTLQRHLLSEGSSYKDAFNCVRRDLAIEYIRSAHLSLDDIAEKLGFSETRSFHRSFKQWTGETIGSFRAHIAQ